MTAGRTLAVLFTLAVGGCRACERESPRGLPDLGAPVPPVDAAPVEPTDDAGSEIVEVLPLSGFDPKGEPRIERMRDGSLVVVFNFMPPSWADDDDAPRFEQFDRELARMIGVRVEWDDRERFVIPRPKPDTVERLRVYLGRFRSR
jgi:hypothetical protein